MTAADYADLARLAEAATKGEWARQPDDGGSLFGPAGGDGLGQVWGPNWRRNVDYIVAANPATILRLVNENENLRGEVQHIAEGLGKSAKKRNDLRAERDALAARLAAVGEVIRIHETTTDIDGGGRGLVPTDTLRAALATDTTKEN